MALDSIGLANSANALPLVTLSAELDLEST